VGNQAFPDYGPAFYLQRKGPDINQKDYFWDELPHRL